ncbi:MAG: response regulator [Thermodesulfobacteriota bacterium]|nr:response regulator [Thermodesulfobacteriota bacterium]
MEINPKKIAVVDDSKLSRNLITTALSTLPWTDVSSFEDGQKAWTAFQNGDSADIVITDVNMPEMDGFELLHRVKEKYPQKPCIVISATPRYKKTARDLSADCFLAKPFSMMALLKVVEQFA